MASDEDWTQAMRDLREMLIAEDLPQMKRRVFDLILSGPKPEIERRQDRPKERGMP